MAYKNDSYLVIANKFSSASGDAKAQLWETYDQLRDLTVSGNGLGFRIWYDGRISCTTWQAYLRHRHSRRSLVRRNAMNIPGTSYASEFKRRLLLRAWTRLYNYSGFPSRPLLLYHGGLSGYATGGASSIVSGWGTDTGVATGYASGIGGIADVASAAAYGLGAANGYGFSMKNLVSARCRCYIRMGWNYAGSSAVS